MSLTEEQGWSELVVVGSCCWIGVTQNVLFLRREVFLDLVQLSVLCFGLVT